MNNLKVLKERMVKEIIQHLIENYLGKEYVLVHRKAYTDLLEHKVKKHECACGHCKSK